MLESEKTADDDVGTKEGTDDGTGGPIAMDADQKSEPKRRGRKSTPVVRIETGETFPNAAAASKRAGCSRQTMQLRRRPQQDRRRAPMGIRRAKGAELEDPVVCLDTQMRFPGVKEAAAWAGCVSAVLAGCANPAGGYRWERSETDADRDATDGQDQGNLLA